MNSHGQTLVLFVILIPLLLGMGAFVIDTAYLLKENTKLKSTTRTIIEQTKDIKDTEEQKEKIKTLYEKNKIPTENLIYKIEDDGKQIENTYQIESIFGAIIGLKEYTIKIQAKIE